MFVKFVMNWDLHGCQCRLVGIWVFLSDNSRDWGPNKEGVCREFVNEANKASMRLYDYLLVSTVVQLFYFEVFRLWRFCNVFNCYTPFVVSTSKFQPLDWAVPPRPDRLFEPRDIFTGCVCCSWQYLNSHQVLYKALVDVEQSNTLTTEEARRAAKTLRIDFERGGIHLSPGEWALVDSFCIRCGGLKKCTREGSG